MPAARQLLNAWAALGDEPHPASEGARELGDRVERALTGRRRQRGLSRHRPTPALGSSFAAVPAAPPTRSPTEPSGPCARSRDSRFQPPVKNPMNIGFSSLCAPGKIRTSDPRIRSPMLYPAELRVRRGRVHSTGYWNRYWKMKGRLSARGWAGGGRCGPGLKRLQSRGATMTAKPGQTSSGAGLLHWKGVYLSRMTRLSQGGRHMAQKLL